MLDNDLKWALFFSDEIEYEGEEEQEPVEGDAVEDRDDDEDEDDGERFGLGSNFKNFIALGLFCGSFRETCVYWLFRFFFFNV